MWAVVIAVRVQNDGEAVEIVGRTEHVADLVAIAHVPEHEAVAEQVLALAVHTKLKLNFPVGHVNWLQVSKYTVKFTI